MQDNNSSNDTANDDFSLFNGIGEAGNFRIGFSDHELDESLRNLGSNSLYSQLSSQSVRQVSRPRRKKRKLGRKIYFQIQTNNRVRVYEVVTSETERKQNSLETLSSEDAISSELLEKLSPEDLERLHYYLRLIHQQEQYEEVCAWLAKMPKLLDNAAELLGTNSLPINEGFRSELLSKMKAFIDQLSKSKTNSSLPQSNY